MQMLIDGNAGNNVSANSGAVVVSIGWTTAEEDANVLEKLGMLLLYTARYSNWS